MRFLNREPLPFKFQGDVREEPTRAELAVLEAAARRGRARRPASYTQQRRDARDQQAASGTYVRIQRPIANYRDFLPQMSAWYKLEAEGLVARRKLGNASSARSLHVTLLDTRDIAESIGRIDDSLETEDLERQLERRNPALFRKTGQIAFNGLELFGPKFRPWVAMPISPDARSLHHERRDIRSVIAPLSGDSDNKLHSSLGDIIVHDSSKIAETFETLKAGIIPLLPDYIEYGPAIVTVGRNPQ